MRFQAYLPFLLASLALATPIAQDAGENPNLVGEPDTQGLDITAERFIAFERPDGYNPSLTQTDIECMLLKFHGAGVNSDIQCNTFLSTY